MKSYFFRIAVPSLALASITLGILGCPPKRENERDHDHKEGDEHDSHEKTPASKSSSTPK